MRWRFLLLVSLVLALMVLPAFGAPPSQKTLKAEVSYPVAVASSPAFRDLPVDNTEVTVGTGINRTIPNPQLNKTNEPAAPESFDVDAVLQYRHGNAPAPSPLINFDGLANVDGVAPPDTQGDIGPNHYMQWVNLHLAAWSINRTTWTPTLVLGPVAGNSIWAALGGQCASDNWGDPIVLWDRFRSRWVISQFSLGGGAGGPYKTAIAVSKTADPTGAWWLYCYDYHPTTMNDYPKFGVWPDGYYYTCNQFTGGGSAWGGAGLMVFEADKMINGDVSAKQLKVDLGAVSLNYGGILPAHFEGTINPPAGSGYFVEVDDSTWMSPPLAQDSISLWKTSVNWATSTFNVGVGGLPDLTIPVTNFTPLCIGNRNCIPQPGTTQRVDAIADRGMYRLQYRNFGSYEAMVFNLTVDSGSAVAGVRWFELRKDGGHPDWYLYQEGTYAPADGKHRWMGSAAQDHMGDLCVGYSLSDGTATYPSVGYAGRLAGDPIGTLPQSEVIMHSGAASQTGVNRWGDYSTMSIDPVDDCTFWYTQEYTTGGWNWATRIGAFKFGGCSIGPTGTLSGTVVDASTLAPISGATVTAVGTVSAAATTGPTGAYTLTLPVDTYNVTASAFGYNPVTVNGIVITNGATTTQDFALAAAGSHTMQFNVKDVTTNWPLYARIDVTGDMGYPGASFWVDPVTGATAALPFVDGVSYTLSAVPWVPGYAPIPPVTLPPFNSNLIVIWSFSADTSACNAPGYQLDYVYMQDFEAGNGGYVASGTNSSWAYGVPTSGPGNAHSPTHAWATNLAGNYNVSENSYITSPAIDLSAHAGDAIILEWWQWLNCESGYDYASVQATSDGITWNTVYGPVSGNIDAAWTKHSVTLATSYATANFQVRFHFTSDSSVQYAGWYVDDVGVAAIAVPPAPPPIFFEGFEGSFPPASWNLYQKGDANAGWLQGTTGSVGSHGSPHSGTYYAWHNDDNVATNVVDWMVSPQIAVAAGYNLEFWQRKYYTSYTNPKAVYITTGANPDPAVSTYVLLEDETAVVTTSWVKRTISLAAYVGQTVHIAFQYQGDWDDEWYIDDVAIPDPAAPPPPVVSCIAPAAGGIIVGQVNDANTGGPVAGATVTNAATTKVVTSQATPDPAVGDAFYCIFANTGNGLTASKAPYGSDSTTAGTFPPARILTHDFALTAGLLAATPSSLVYGLPTNQTDSEILNLANVGASPVNWTVKELLGHVLAPSGNLFACVTERPGPTKIQWMEAKAQGKAKERQKQDGSAQPEEMAPVGSNSGRAPAGSRTEPGVPVAQSLKALLPAGTTAYAINIYPGNGTVVSFDCATPGTWTTHGDAGGAYFAGDFVMGDTTKLYALDYNTNQLVTINTATAAVTVIGPAVPIGGQSWTGMTAANTGEVYVSSTTCSSSTLYTIDIATGALTTIGTVTNAACLIDIAIDSSGNLYGLDIINDNLVSINKTTGAGTIIGPVGFNANYAQGMDFDDATNTLYLAAYSSLGQLMTCNTSTGAATLVGAFPGGAEVDCLAFTSFTPSDIPWLDETPKLGTIAGGANMDVTVSYDATGLATGPYLATLSFTNDTPYGPLNVPVTLNVWEPVAAGAPLSGQAPVTVAFTGSITNPTGSYTYDWDFGDGSPHSGAQNPTHIYNVAGNFTIIFSATDSWGHTASDSHLVANITVGAIPVVYNFYDDQGRARVCVNRLTGAYAWTVSPGIPGTTYTGVATVSNGGTKIYSKPGDPYYLNVTYDPLRKRALGYFSAAGVYSTLSDYNTTNNPPGCY